MGYWRLGDGIGWTLVLARGLERRQRKLRLSCVCRGCGVTWRCSCFCAWKPHPTPRNQDFPLTTVNQYEEDDDDDGEYKG